MLKPWAEDGYNFSERIWRDKQKLISVAFAEITKNILTGQNPQKAIDAIAKKMNTSKYNAGRLVMTEEAYFSSLATGEAYKAHGYEQYQILATLDNRTSEICQQMDQKPFPVSEYQAGVTAPPFHVLCRSTTVPYFDKNYSVNAERSARDPETEKTYYVPADMTYSQWKQKFVDGVDNQGIGGIIESGAISGALNPYSKEANIHAIKYYESVRHMKTDVKRISKATGISELKIYKIKQHVFIKEHNLIEGKKRFDPDYEMAQSWQRLIDGKNIKKDIVLLKHEYAELRYMEKGLSQNEAHIKASKKYNFAKYCD